MNLSRTCIGTRWQQCLPVAVTVILAVSAPRMASGFVEIANGELLFETSARLTRDSNVFADEREISDTIYSLEPGFAYSREVGRLNVDARVAVAMNRFSDLDDEDSDDVSARFNASIPSAATSPLKGNFEVTYFNGRRVDIYLNDRFQVETFGVGGQGSYQFSPKTQVRFGADYGASYPEDLPNSHWRTARLGLGYNLRPAVVTFLDYRFRRSKSETDLFNGFGVNNRDHAIFVGIDGDLSPVLSGLASIGYQTRSADANDVGGEDNRLVSQVSLTWQARQLTKVGFVISADSVTTNAGRTVDRTGLNLSVDQAVGPTLHLNGSVEWARLEYRGAPEGTDNERSAQIGLHYEAYKYVTAGVEATYYFRNPEFIDSFERTVLSVYATLRY